MSSELQERTATYIIVAFTFLLLLITLLMYIYYQGGIFFSGLQQRECNTMTSVYGTLNGKISSVDGTLKEFDYTLKDYYIKSSYNSCCGGSYRNDYVDLCHLKAVLANGVRGIDIQIFSVNGEPEIGVSTSSDICYKESFNSVPYADFMRVLVEYGFTNSNAPNYLDPILLHMRISTEQSSAFEKMSATLKNYESTYLLGKSYSYESNGDNLCNAKLRDLMGKVVIIVDRSNPAFLDYPEFYEYVNMTSNSMFMRVLRYNDVVNNSDITELIEYNKKAMTFGIPDTGANPANPSSAVLKEAGVQMLGMRYGYIDTNVEDNDAFFDMNGHAFVLKPEHLRYVPVVVESPPEQNPEVSYATRTVTSDYYSFNI